MTNVNESDFLADLYLFYRYFIASNYKDSVPAPHIKKLSKKLMELALHGDGKHRLAVSMPPRHDLSKDTPVYTSNRGWITHGELQVGDYVIHPTGKPIEVLKVLPTTYCDNQLEFSNGDKIICGDYHIWKIYDELDNTTQLYYTYQIKEDNLFLNNTYNCRYKIQYKNKYISLIRKSKLKTPVPSNCITVDSKDGLYLVGKNKTPTHNSKSSMVTLAFPLWLLFQDPNVNIMIVTGSPKLAEKFGIQLREYVRELGHYFNVYLSNVKQASTHIMFCDKDGKLYRGNIMLASSGGGITGQDADYLILDDPYTGNDSEFTPSALQQKIDWVNRVVEQRIEPHTKYCVLHTRWHPIKLDTPILTLNRGWVTHGELEVGDEVFRPNGESTKVTNVYAPVFVDNCFEFSNGDKIVSGDHHLWSVYDWSNRKQRLMETHEIMERPTLVGKKSRSNFLVDNHECLDYPYQEVPIDPYWLGLWLGDGHHKRPSITIDANDKISMSSTVYDVVRYDECNGNCIEAFYTHQGLTGKLKELNVFGNKHIPNCYLYNSKNIRLNLLAGLIDSDGSVEKSSNRVIFINTNKDLLKNVHELITGLGFNVKIEKRPVDKINEYKQKSNSLQIKSNMDCYALKFTPHYPIPTKIPRKEIKGNRVSKRIGLTDKYKVEKVLGNCITVDAEDGMYLVGRNLTPTHNSNDIIGYYKETEPELYDFVEFPALDDEGMPLWKERYTREELLKKKEIVGARVFESVYQQKPIDTTSDFFNIKNLKFGLPDGYVSQSSVRGWDIASSDALSSNDFTAGVLMHRFDDYAVISDLVHGRFGGQTKQVIKGTAMSDTPNVHVLVETGVAGAGELLYQEWRNQLTGYIVERANVSGRGNKSDRATPLQNAIEDGKVYVNISDPVLRDSFIKELKGFPNLAHDDIVDATAHCYNYLFMNDKLSKKINANFGVVHLW